MIDVSKLDIVSSDDIFDGKLYHKDGILSEQIFGSDSKNVKCQCGNLTGYINISKKCPVCGVICSTNEMRYTKFAKIVLNAPVYHPIFNSELKSLCSRAPNILDPVQADMSSENPVYLQCNNSSKGNKYSLSLVYDSATCLPFSITGLFSLYIALATVPELSNILLEFMDYVLITPPKTRPITHRSDKLIIGELNTLYQRLIRINRYLTIEFENMNTTSHSLIAKYITLIENKIESGDFKNPLYFDELISYDTAIAKLQYYTNKIYNHIVDMLSGKKGLIRGQFLSRTIDFSSRAVITVDPSLKAYEIKIPKQIFLKLFMLEFLYWLNENQYIINKLDFMSYIYDTEYIMNYIQYFNEFCKWFFEPGNIELQSRLVLMNRQPTLFRYGLSCVEVVGVVDDYSIQISPLILEQYNADFDGDKVALYKVHDVNSLQELESNSFNKVITHYEHNNKPLHTIRLEAVYSFNVLSSIEPNYEITPIEISNLSELDDNYVEIETPIRFNGQVYTYGIGLINKWCYFKDIKITKTIKPQEISELIFRSMSKDDYHNRLFNLNTHLYWFAITNPTYALTFPIESIMYSVHGEDL